MKQIIILYHYGVIYPDMSGISSSVRYGKPQLVWERYPIARTLITLPPLEVWTIKSIHLLLHGKTLKIHSVPSWTIEVTQVLIDKSTKLSNCKDLPLPGFKLGYRILENSPTCRRVFILDWYNVAFIVRLSPAELPLSCY